MEQKHVTVVGGGLAGSEAAYQLALRKVAVTLYEMRPQTSSPAHHSSDLAELVCSNSFKSADPTTAAGLLKEELRRIGSLLIRCADRSRVPAGGALAVDRKAFSRRVTEVLEAEPLIEIVRSEITELPKGPVIIATGPLSSSGIQPLLDRLVGSDRLAFYDAAAPIVMADSLDRSELFAQSRYDKGDTADYLNAPMSKDEYETFITELLSAQRVTAKAFETADLFSACQPIEEVARKGRDAPRFGALKPVGLTDPRTGERPWAAVQLRAENIEKQAYNLVGFQTNLTFSEQKRVFSLIPGLKNAEFARYGVMHRNTFIDSPRALDGAFSVSAGDDTIYFAGQITGTEGYAEAVASGLFAALNCYATLSSLPMLELPKTTAFGALVHYATDPNTENYQPMHVNFGIMPPLEVRIRNKKDRYAAYASRARSDLETCLVAATKNGLFPKSTCFKDGQRVFTGDES